MNEDIATSVATRPAERAMQLENQALNAFRDRLAHIRTQYAHQDDEIDLPYAFAHGRHVIRRREQYIALARVTAQLHGQGIDVGLPRTEPDGFFHTIDPRLSFTTCSTCGGSVVWSPPCHFGDAA